MGEISSVEKPVVLEKLPEGPSPENLNVLDPKPMEGQPVPVRTKETPPSPSPKKIPEEVVEKVETRDPGGVFQLKREIPVGDGPSAAVSGGAPGASELTQEVNALRSASNSTSNTPSNATPESSLKED